MDRTIVQRLLGGVFICLLFSIGLKFLLEKPDEVIKDTRSSVIQSMDWIDKKELSQVKQHMEAFESGKSQQALVVQDRPLANKNSPRITTEGNIDKQGQVISWTLQVASFKEIFNAVALRDRLQKEGYKAYIKLDETERFIRVYVGPTLNRLEIERWQKEINKVFKETYIVRYQP